MLAGTFISGLITMNISYGSISMPHDLPQLWAAFAEIFTYGFLVCLVWSIYLVIHFARHVLPVRKDLKNHVKDQIIFHPTPYHVTGTNQFFIKTGIPSLEFIEISYEAFIRLNGTEMLVLEIAPASGVRLGVKPLMDIIDMPHGAPGEL